MTGVNIDKAAEQYEKSLEIDRKTGDARGEGIVLMNLGNVFKDRSQYPKAVEYYEKSLELKRKTGDVQGESQTLGNLGLSIIGGVNMPRRWSITRRT